MRYLAILSFAIVGIVPAHSGTFYTTSKEFYEGCWERDKADTEAWKAEVGKRATAKTPRRLLSGQVAVESPRAPGRPYRPPRLAVSPWVTRHGRVRWTSVSTWFGDRYQPPSFRRSTASGAATLLMIAVDALLPMCSSCFRRATKGMTFSPLFGARCRGSRSSIGPSSLMVRRFAGEARGRLMSVC